MSKTINITVDKNNNTVEIEEIITNVDTKDVTIKKDEIEHNISVLEEKLGHIKSAQTKYNEEADVNIEEIEIVIAEFKDAIAEIDNQLK